MSMKDIESQEDYYAKIGFCEQLGFGDRPAVLVIDMCRGITEPGKLYIAMDAQGRKWMFHLDTEDAF